MSKKTETSFDFKQVGVALREARDQVSRLDRELDELIDQRESVARAPVHKGEAIDEMKRQVDLAAKNGALALRDSVTSLARGRPLDIHSLLVHQTPGNPDSVRPRDDVLTSVLQGPLKDALADAISNSPAFDDDALPQAERARRITELDAEIEGIEGVRDGLLQQLREAGLDIQDADEEVTAE